MFRFTLLTGSILALASTGLAQAQTPDFSNKVHDIIVSSNIPTLNVTVRNTSASTDPANRNLRMVSDDPQISVDGQVWCKQFDNATNAPSRAQLMIGSTSIVATEYGAGPLPLGVWASSSTQNINTDWEIADFDLSMTYDMPDSWQNQLVTLFFNPVEVVESRLEQYVANNAGSEADFLRVDDVFEVTVPLNVVGWCEFDGQSYSGEYGGMRTYDMKVAIFYQGDDDIQDVITAFDSANTVAAQPADRAREVTRTRSSTRNTPARNTTRSRPRRAPSN